MTDEVLRAQLLNLKETLQSVASDSREMRKTVNEIDKRLVIIETRAAVIGALAGVIVSVIVALIA